MKNATTKIVAILAAAASLLFIFVTILPAQDGAAAKDDFVKFIILHSNDIHGQLLPRPARGRANEQMGGAAAIEAAVARERENAQKLGARLLLIDSGDWYQGTPEGNHKKDGVNGALVVDWMNRARFDAAVIGNHEFDYGAPNVLALAARAKFTVLGANILMPVAGGPPAGENAQKTAPALAPIAKPFVVYEHGGVKLAIVGLLTSETPRMVAEGRLGNITIPDEFEQARRWVDIAKKEADIVIIAGHLGNDIDKKLTHAVPEVPVLLGGHSHTFVKQPNSVEHEAAAIANNPWKSGRAPKTYILQSGSKAENLDRVEISIDPKDKKIERIETRNLELYIKEYGEDAEAKKWLAAEIAADPILKGMDQKIADVAAPASPAPKGYKTDPTGNVATESMLWRAKKIDDKIQIAFNNSTGIRSKLSTGPLTRRHVYEVLPFENTITILTMSGEDLLAFFGETIANNGRPLTAGLEGIIKKNGNEIDAAELRVGGKPFDRTVNYKIAANSFIAAGNARGYTAFANGRDKRDTGILTRDALSEYAVERKTVVLDDLLRLKLSRGAGADDEEKEPAEAGASGGGVKK